jgi:hypothetical protein
MTYTPPESLGYLVEHNVKSGLFKWSFHPIEEGMTFYTDNALQIIPVVGQHQLRWEAERVRRETIEECASLMEDQDTQAPKYNASAIRGLLK